MRKPWPVIKSITGKTSTLAGMMQAGGFGLLVALALLLITLLMQTLETAAFLHAISLILLAIGLGIFTMLTQHVCVYRCPGAAIDPPQHWPNPNS